MRLMTALAAATAVTGVVMAGGAPATAVGAGDPEHVCVGSVPETDPLEPGPVSICVSVFKPAAASPDNRVPVLLHSHGWGGSRTSAPGSFRRYLDAGFGVVSIDQRGLACPRRSRSPTVRSPSPGRRRWTLSSPRSARTPARS